MRYFNVRTRNFLNALNLIMVAVHVNSVLSGEKFTLKLGLKTTFDKIRNSFQYKELQFIYF